MIYTELTKKAMLTAFGAHMTQKDKNGVPYIFHPAHVAESMTDEKTCCVALLHDTVEDTDITVGDIRADFGDEIADAVALLTHEDGTDYFEYVRKIKENPIAAAVKLSDLRHNSDLSRLHEVTEKDVKRRKKYLTAIKILTGEAK